MVNNYRGAFLRRRITKIEYDGDVFYVRPLSGAELENMIEEQGDEELEGIRALSRVCMYCLVDADGNQVFDPARDYDEVRAADISLLKKVSEVALEISGLAETDSGNA